MAAAEHRAEEPICVSCGLCCDGTLFVHAQLVPGDDTEVLTRADVRVSPAGDFPLPCSALDERRCTVYARRPGVCRDYRCELLVQVDDGSVSRQEALDIIATTIEVRDRLVGPLQRVAVYDRPLPLVVLMSVFESYLQSVGDAERARHRPVQLDVGLIRMLLVTHFKATLYERAPVV